MALDSALLEILRCPADHAELAYDAAAQTLTCAECARVFRVVDDVPVMLLDEAVPAQGEAPADEPAEGAK